MQLLHINIPLLSLAMVQQTQDQPTDQQIKSTLGSNPNEQYQTFYYDWMNGIGFPLKKDVVMNFLAQTDAEYKASTRWTYLDQIERYFTNVAGGRCVTYAIVHRDMLRTDLTGSQGLTSGEALRYINAWLYGGFGTDTRPREHLQAAAELKERLFGKPSSQAVLLLHMLERSEKVVYFEFGQFKCDLAKYLEYAIIEGIRHYSMNAKEGVLIQALSQLQLQQRMFLSKEHALDFMFLMAVENFVRTNGQSPKFVDLSSDMFKARCDLVKLEKRQQLRLQTSVYCFVFTELKEFTITGEPNKKQISVLPFEVGNGGYNFVKLTADQKLRIWDEIINTELRTRADEFQDLKPLIERYLKPIKTILNNRQDEPLGGHTLMSIWQTLINCLYQLKRALDELPFDAAQIGKRFVDNAFAEMEYQILLKLYFKRPELKSLSYDQLEQKVNRGERHCPPNGEIGGVFSG